MYYILEGKTPVLAKDVLVWSQWFEQADKQVLFTEIGDVKVSTVFLGIDHGFGMGSPQVFETIIWNGNFSGQTRYWSTWEQAEAGHNTIVADERKTYLNQPASKHHC